MNVTGHAMDEPAPLRRGTVSIRDVAKHAGVSYQTVSRVINDSPRVRDDTRERVQTAIEELGFRRSATALALASGRTRVITVLTANTTLYGYAATLQGIEEAARAARYSVVISVLESSSDDVVEAAVEHAVADGGAVIVIAYDNAGVRARQLLPHSIPYAAAVETPAESAAPDTRLVWADDRAAAATATGYLLELGHRTVHYVPLPSPTGTSQRAHGWRTALTTAGAAVPEPQTGGWDASAGYRAGKILAGDPGATAILCGNDDLAVGVLRAMHEAGRDVPGEVSVTGFDDAPQSAFLIPSLTTIRLDFAGLGRACVARLLTQLEPAANPLPAEVSAPQLLVRESTGPLVS